MTSEAPGIFTRRELMRRAVHIFPGFLPFVLGWIPHSDPLLPSAVYWVAGVTTVLSLAVFAIWRTIARSGEVSMLGAILAFPLVGVGPLLMFPERPEIAALAIVVLAFGDGLATFAAAFPATPRLPWNPEKTWLGSIIFLAASIPLATLAIRWIARPQPSLMVAAGTALAACGAGMLAESVPSKIDDNLRVGLAAAVAGLVALSLFD